MDVHTDLPAGAWDEFVAAHPQGHILQTAGWGELKAAFGWKAERVALLEDGAPRAGALVLYRPLPAGLGSLVYVPRGPVMDWERPGAAELLDVLCGRARARRAVVLILEPDLPDHSLWRERLTALGLRPSPLGSIQPRQTIVVDIGRSEEEILAGMKPKTRYNIRLAERKGVTVWEGTEADLPAFHQLMAQTAARDRFGIHSPAYYEQAYRLFVLQGRARLLMAGVEGEPVAALMAFALGKRAWYFYGASGDTHREKMPTYRLQWEAIRWARSQGCTEYDLWGVPDEDEERLEAEFTRHQDGLWGVYRFKRGFGGQLVRTVGAWERPFHPLLHRLYALATAVQRRLPRTAGRSARP